MKQLLVILFCLSPCVALAGSHSMDFQAQVNLLPECQVRDAILDFGTLGSDEANNVISAGSLIVECTGALPFNVKPNFNSAGLARSGGSYDLTVNVYGNSALTTPLNYSATGIVGIQSVPFWAKLTSNVSSPEQGTYTGKVAVTLTF